jgi:hypothetical protein
VSEPAVPTAAELAGRAELMVRQAEHALAAATDPTVRDVAETELQAALALQDQVMTAVASALERGEHQIRRQALAALDPRSDSELRHDPGSEVEADQLIIKGEIERRPRPLMRRHQT